MMFHDRVDAGKQLVSRLEKYRNKSDTVVIGLPRGGVVTAYEVAKALNLTLDVIFPRKVGAPFSPELAIGAVTETGEGVFNEELIMQIGVSDAYLKQEVEKEKRVAQRRLDIYRKVCPKISLENKVVILIDDGLATGATMRAAVQSVKAEGANRIIVAVPITPQDTLLIIKEEADEVIALDAPRHFQAVGQFYENFVGTEDDEVIDILKKSRAT